MVQAVNAACSGRWAVDHQRNGRKAANKAVPGKNVTRRSADRLLNGYRMGIDLGATKLVSFFLFCRFSFLPFLLFAERGGVLGSGETG